MRTAHLPKSTDLHICALHFSGATATYALYELHGYINPFFAQETGFSDEDLDLFLNSLTQMFDHDRSASRGEMSACRLIVFKHETALGNSPAKKLFALVKVKAKPEVEVPRSFDDYEVTVNEADCPKGIEINQIL